MKFKDYYEVLGVARDATADEIKRAYRKLARAYHPDVSTAPDAQARMSEINEAYAVLSDAARRATYDRIGQGRRGGEPFQAPPGWDEGFVWQDGAGDPASDAAFSEFFDALFGGFGARRRAGPAGGAGASRGGDVHGVLTLDLADAWRGGERDVSLRVPAIDEQGQRRSVDKVLRVQIPRGVRPGQRIRLAGQGEAGRPGQPAGDLYLEVRLRPHPRFTVDGRDVRGQLRVAPWEAALGAVVPVTLPDGGTIKVRIPPGAQHGRVLTVRGHGIPGDPPGDLDLVVQVILPPADTPAARACYENMARELAFDPRASVAGS